MSKNILNYYYIVLGILLSGLSGMLFQACSKNEVEQILPSSTATYGQLLKIEKGCLVFNDHIEFDSVVTLTQNFYKEEILAWQEIFPTGDFLSMGAAYQQAKEDVNRIQNSEDFSKYPNLKSKWAGKVVFDEQNYDVERILDFPFLQNVLNCNGMAKIGNKYVRFYNDAIVFAPEEAYDMLVNMKIAPTDISNLEGVVFLKIERKKVITDLNEIGERNQLLQGQVYSNGSNNGSKRLTGEAEVILINNAAGGTGVAGCGSQIYTASFRDRVFFRVKCHEKKWWGWKDFTTNLDYNASGIINETVSGTNASFTSNPLPFSGYSQIELSNSYWGTSSALFCPGTIYANFIFGEGSSMDYSAPNISLSGNVSN